MNTELLWLAGFTGSGVFLTLGGLMVCDALGMGQGITDRFIPASAPRSERAPELVTVTSVRLDLPEAA